MSWARRPVCWLVAALVSGAASGPARADEPEEPMPESLRARAEHGVLRGEFLLLVRSPDYARWLGLGSMPAPLSRWRIDIGWERRADGTVGLASPPAPPEPPWTWPLGLAAAKELERWPLFAGLLAERHQREAMGATDLPTGSPLAALPDRDGTIARFLDLQRSVFHPVPIEESPDPAWAAKARAGREQAASLRSTAHLWIALAASLLLALTLLAGLLAKPRS